MKTKPEKRRTTMNKKLLSIFIFILCGNAFALGRLDFSYGYFSIKSKADNKETSVSNPSAMNVAYLFPIMEKIHLNFGYSVLLADFSGSDKGYGLNLGFNFYPFSSGKNENYKNERVEIERFEALRPYVGVAFYQRDFQSIKNSYAGFGISPGIERYINKNMSLKSELRLISLSGSNSSTAIETDLFVGVIFNI